MSLLSKLIKPKKCRFFHRFNEWVAIHNPHHYTTSTMYKCGVRPTKMRICECGKQQQLHLEKW